jgi:hypothetical protein
VDTEEGRVKKDDRLKNGSTDMAVKNQHKKQFQNFVEFSFLCVKQLQKIFVVEFYYSLQVFQECDQMKFCKSLLSEETLIPTGSQQMMLRTK